MFCFLHIEKAAGTTLHAVLRNNFPSYVCLGPRSGWDAEQYERTFRPASARWMFRRVPGPAGFGGHRIAPTLDYEGALGRGITWFTFLRDPLARYRSQYRHLRVRDGLDLTPDQFLDDPRYHDLMTRRIAGERSLDRATRILDRDFAFVGLTEHYDESLLMLRQALGAPRMDMRYERRNVTPRDSQPVPELDEERMRENNRLDLALYDHAVRNLYPAQRERYSGDLELDLAAFTAANEGFRFPPLKDRLLTLWTGHVLYRLEKLASRRMGHPAR